MYAMLCHVIPHTALTTSQSLKVEKLLSQQNNKNKYEIKILFLVVTYEYKPNFGGFCKLQFS
jgi:hypothetical protein